MRYIFTLVLGLLTGAASIAAPPEAEPAGSGDAALISRVRQVVNGMLTRLPDYTCLETLERTERPEDKKKFSLLDRVRVEVAFVNGAESYAWPGSTKFGGINLLRAISDQGAFGTGDFGEHLKVTYRAGMPLQLAGRETLNGRDAWKFTEIVPASVSHFAVIARPATAIVGYTVTAWHDAASLDLLRIELRAAGFPRKIPFQRVFKATDYGTVQVNGMPIRLPVMTELSVITRNGLENRTVSTFSNCREYVGESKLIFDEPAPEQGSTTGEATPQPRTDVDLPAGVQVQVRLDQAVDLKRAARGDFVTMTVSRDSIRDGRKVLSTGASVKGRWTFIECHDLPIAYCFAILETESYEDGGTSGPFRGALLSPSMERELAMGGRGIAAVGPIDIPDAILRAGPGAPVVYAGIITKLPRGYRLIWRTLEVSGGTKP